MKIVIAGGSGFLGQSLERFFEANSDSVKILTRNPKRKNDVYWDAKNLGDWSAELESTDVLINLTGKSVDCRYTEKNRREIYESRIHSTAVLQKAFDACKNPPKLFLNASSATVYIHSETHLNTEESGIIGDDFSMNICKSWEAEFFKKQNLCTRKVAMRTSIVLGRAGGAFPKFLQVAKLGLGGKQGSGKQWVSWIHIQDFCEAVQFIIENEKISGCVNITAPEPCTNVHLMRIIRNNLRVPVGISSPIWLLELGAIFLSTETELMLKSRNVFPKILLENGYQFNFPDIETALADLV